MLPWLRSISNKKLALWFSLIVELLKPEHVELSIDGRKIHHAVQDRYRPFKTIGGNCIGECKWAKCLCLLDNALPYGTR